MLDEKFDAVQMTREIRDRMYEETKLLSDEDLIRYFRERAETVCDKHASSRGTGQSTRR